MNRYSRINNSKSKSVAIDFSDHLSLPIPKVSKHHDEKYNKNESSEKSIHEEEGDGEMFGVILSRSQSVSSYKLMVEKERRSSSMKRSLSVSSAYCRIHQNDEEETDKLNVMHRKKEKGKIFRACMRLLRF
ncbi:hypothetical protein K7X08_000543 [Anisodus acutangulus]|uniref:Uncharacterized protein n=1 Tax=Anisodus acutangulus TaxID=402998 RepID=A0A9Q1M760_9SOLA|nr:hypothetical protein K7X08_000543 [Anisodus acutangulus]